MLKSEYCDLFDRPFFQFSQLKKYAPETIPHIKANYKNIWQIWQQTINQVAHNLAQYNSQFALPHIERWCNGWQVRAHFFAFFKYAQHNNDAAILSILLNRRRLTVSLDWHCYKENLSTINLAQYNQWINDLDIMQFNDFEVWHGIESEYADYTLLSNLPENKLILHNEQDFFCIGKHLYRDEISQNDSATWITQQILALTPLYEKCFQAA